MRAAVVGGGLFGCTAAVELARAGAAVDLYERHHDVMLGASRANQGRLHAGYHYPRSLATAREVRDAGPQLAARYPAAVVSSMRHHYLVAEGSLVPGEKYLAFLDELGLPYRQVTHPLVRNDTVEVALRVDGESFLGLAALRGLVRSELLAEGVDMRFGHQADPAVLAGSYDVVVDATYGATRNRPLRYELCEIALLRLGQQYAGLSFVVVDGEYCSLDPLAGTDVHMLYDVRHSVHHVASRPDAFPAEYCSLIDRGPKRTRLTNVSWMEQSARRYLLGMGMPEYRGSLFTVRAVLPDVDDTDARPTVVERDGNLVTVFSGKIATALSAAKRVAELAGEVAA